MISLIPWTLAAIADRIAERRKDRAMRDFVEALLCPGCGRVVARVGAELVEPGPPIQLPDGSPVRTSHQCPGRPEAPKTRPRRELRPHWFR